MINLNGKRPKGRASDAASRFVLRLVCVVVLPLGLIMTPGELILWRLADGVYPAMIARLQHDDPHLAWVGPVRLYSAIKVARLQLDAPEIAVIGASRSGEFRSAMFTPYRFYNASMSGWSLGRQHAVLDRISAAHAPRIVIINLDYFTFAAGYDTDSLEAKAEAGMPLDYAALRANLDGLTSLAQALGNGFWRTTTKLAGQVLHPGSEQLNGYRLFGFTALPGSQTAFRHDGSMYYFPDAIADPGHPVRRASRMLGAVPPGKGGRMDEGHVERLRSFAELARQRGITVVAVQLPLPKPVLDVMDAGEDYVDEGQAYRGADMKLWRDFESAQSRQLFDAMGILFVDLARIPETANLLAFIDPAHPGEYLVLAAVIAMLKDPRLSALLPAIDLNALEQRKRQAEADRNYFDVFRDRF